MYKIIICIFGCINIEKYKNEIKKIKETYEKNCNETIKILYFLGEKKCDDYHQENFIYLDNIKDDYVSASYKQYSGLKYIYENYDTEFVLCCGTDTFINIPKLLLFLNNYDKNDNLYIGGLGCNRIIDNQNYYFHSGGPGFILSLNCLKQIYPLLLNNIMDKWINICKNNNKNDWIPCCDLSISYFLQKYINVNIISINDSCFLHCNYKGYPCHVNSVKIENIICCHSMSLDDFDAFNNILIKNNYFL